MDFSGRVRQADGMASLPPLPVTFSRTDLERTGFLGWRSWAQLRGTGFADVPSGPATYVVHTPAVDPVFLDLIVGVRFMGCVSKLSLGTLKVKWVTISASINT